MCRPATDPTGVHSWQSGTNRQGTIPPDLEIVDTPIGDGFRVPLAVSRHSAVEDHVVAVADADSSAIDEVSFDTGSSRR